MSNFILKQRRNAARASRGDRCPERVRQPAASVPARRRDRRAHRLASFGWGHSFRTHVRRPQRQPDVVPRSRESAGRQGHGAARPNTGTLVAPRSTWNLLDLTSWPGGSPRATSTASSRISSSSAKASSRWRLLQLRSIRISRPSANPRGARRHAAGGVPRPVRPPFVAADVNFHKAIFQASNNEFPSSPWATSSKCP